LYYFVFVDCIKTMGCHNGKVASPSANDGAKGTLLVSSQDAAKKNVQVPSEHSPKSQVIFEGRWQDEHGKFVGTIRDGRFVPSIGAPCQLRMDHTTGSIEMFYDDWKLELYKDWKSFPKKQAGSKTADGHFADGKIHWDDGQVWSCQSSVWSRHEDTTETEVVMPPVEPTSTDAQSSTCRHDGTSAENAVIERSEEAPHSMSQPALVATGDTSQDQPIQEVVEHEGKSEGELEHHMLGMKPSEAVGEAHEAQDTNVRSPSFSGDTDPKVFGDSSDISRLPPAPRKERCGGCC
jgi:hypothetical protein